MKQKKIIGCALCALLGLAMLVAGIVLIFILTSIIHNQVEDGLALKKDSASYNNWQEPSTPIYFQVWMFDVRNYQEVIDNGAKPDLLQMGPYTYREHREKFDIKYDNGTISYREKKTYVFDEKMSNGSESDTFHCVNLPLLTVFDMLRYKSSFIKIAAQTTLSFFKEHLFKKLTVHDLLWGYEVPFLKDADVILKFLNKTIPSTFGLFSTANNTDDGVYTIYSGLDGNLDHFGEIISWNGAQKLSYWNSETANAINGSDGTLYPPFIDTNKTKYLFSSDLCRSLGMDYTKGVTNRGIDMDRFVAPEILFGNVTKNPSNAGFCTPPGNCLPSGLLNVSICRQGAPVVMSMPHFLGCDPDVINAVDGLSPNKKEHSSFIDVEPMTGVVMNAGKRLQINVFMEPIDHFTDTEKLKPIFFPVMWLNESAMISASDANKFKDEVLDMIKITDAVKYALIAVGGFILACVLVFVVRARCQPASEKDQRHVQQDKRHLVRSEEYDPAAMPNGYTSATVPDSYGANGMPNGTANGNPRLVL